MVLLKILVITLKLKRAYTSDLLIRAHKAINDLIKFVKNVNSQLATIDISPDTISNFDTIKSKFQYLVEDTDKTIVPHLSAIQSNIDKAFKILQKTLFKTRVFMN